MKVKLLASCVAAPQPRQFLMSYIVNDKVAVDAGSLGLASLEDQMPIKHVLISHTHCDHIASLPIFVENVYDGRPDCVCLYGSEDVHECLQKDVFNDRVWPDFFHLSTVGAPFLKFVPLPSGKTIELAGLKITPIDVFHKVPTQGFIIDDGKSTVVIASDTGPTTAIWERANQASNLKAVFLEASFPNNLQWLADASQHLTPANFAGEIAKLKQQVPIIAVHMKARYYDELIGELNALKLPNLIIGSPGHTYDF